jgi:hypothetical protein
MPFISITRLRVRSVRFLPLFVLFAFRSLRQVKTAAGFQNGSLLADRDWTFWTMTAWDNQDSMRRFMAAGSHKEAMPRLLDWCDEVLRCALGSARNRAPGLHGSRSTDACEWTCIKSAEPQSSACHFELSDPARDEGWTDSASRQVDSCLVNL